MADNPILNRVSGFAAQPVARQISLLVGFAASIALAVGLVNWASSPSYQSIYGPMTPSDNAEAIAILQTNGIEYRLEQRTGLLEVPFDEVLQARMVLASEGFPKDGSGIGFESLYLEQEMGLSSFMEEARYHRAVEAELVRTITALDSVTAARVHLAISRQTAFLRRGNEPSASVMLNLRGGTRLSDRQLSGIINLVASSIPNLDTSRVSVVDGAGKLLSSQGQDSDFGYTAEQFRLAEQFEGSLTDRIIAILEPILGVGAVQAQVTANMDFTRTESTNEIFDPNVALRSEQTSEDISNSTVVAGPPGGLVPNPPQAAQPDDVGQQPIDNGPDRESRQETRNYEVNKTIQYVRSVPGEVNKLSVAVVIDYREDENGERVPLDAALLDQVNALVREAVGFNEARGDTVQVINSPFITPQPLEQLPEPGLFDQPWIWDLGKGLIAALGVLALIFAVLRPMVRYSTNYAPPAIARGTSDAALAGPIAEDAAESRITALTAPIPELPPASPKPNYQQSLAMARNSANEQPVRAAYVVKNWIASDA
ncbi:MAG: flagellar M-ring protein FliF [Proteobacteria bacterium]|nr:flagellar M-ring protein FliF [Pseudomonadota bacterium]